MSRPRQRIAVIGAGIAGLSAAWLLRETHDVTLFEAAPRAGGHADTQTVTLDDGTTTHVDTGFIVLNDRNYPNLTALFAALGVATQPSDMSFAASIDDGKFEYGGGTLAQLFTQKANLIRPRFWRMLFDILRFYREAPALLSGAGEESLGDYLTRNHYSQTFINDHILPMGAAIWSASVANMRAFPARHFARFFQNHGLLSLTNRPQWRTVTGGSKTYVERILADLAATPTQIRLGCGVAALSRAGGINLQLSDGGYGRFDQAILACHADQALALITQPSTAEKAILGDVHCNDNIAILHSDIAQMPRRRGVWSAWNFLSSGPDPASPVTLTYWMNHLQSLPTQQPLLVTLNPAIPPAAAHTHLTRHYRHPQFDAAAMRAQDALPCIQGIDKLWFAGAWTGWGFHEDGISSAVKIAAALGAPAPWAPAPWTQALRANAA